LILGVVHSAPFQMRTAASANSPVETGNGDEAMFITKKSLSRRTVLREPGPWCAAVPRRDDPALTRSLRPRAAFAAIRRGLFPNGAIMNQWTPTATGAGFEAYVVLKPLEPFKDRSSWCDESQRARIGKCAGRPRVSAAGFSPVMWPKRTEAEDVLANTTIDQVVAAKTGQEDAAAVARTPTEDFRATWAPCFAGLSVAAYMNTISWKTPTTPFPWRPIRARVRAACRRHGERGRAPGAPKAAAQHS